MAPAGRFSVNLGTPFWPGEIAGHSPITAIAIAQQITRCLALLDRTAEGGCPHTLFSRDMNCYLIDGVVKITARVPDGSVWLNPSLRVGRARQDRIISSLRGKRVMPEPPRIAGLFVPECCWPPRRPAIGGDLHLRNIGLTGPCDTVHRNPPGLCS